MKKEKIKEIFVESEGFSVTIHNEYEDNGKTVEEKNEGLIETIELILFGLGHDKIEWNEQSRSVYQTICDGCVAALYDAGVIYCGYETSTGESVDYDIQSIYETKLREDVY